MVSANLKNMSQIGNLRQIGVKIEHMWNHHSYHPTFNTKTEKKHALTIFHIKNLQYQKCWTYLLWIETNWQQQNIINGKQSKKKTYHKLINSNSPPKKNEHSQVMPIKQNPSGVHLLYQCHGTGSTGGFPTFKGSKAWKLEVNMDMGKKSTDFTIGTYISCVYIYSKVLLNIWKIAYSIMI